jgi:LA2681-like HEPN
MTDAELELSDDELLQIGERINATLTMADSDEAVRVLEKCIADLARPSSHRVALSYFRGNAHLFLGELLETAAADPVRKYEASRASLRLARTHLFAATIGETISGKQARINLANVLLRCGRTPEAIRLYAESDTALARGYLASTLAGAARQGWVRADSVASEIRTLKAEALGSPEEMEDFAPGSVDLVENIPDLGEQTAHSHLGEIVDPYETWVLNHDLFLRLYAHAVTATARDAYRVRRFRATDDLERDMTLPTMMNTLRADFLFVRNFAWDTLGREPLPDAGYLNTMDYAVYGFALAQRSLAYRAAVDLLDRIAVAANWIFEGGVPSHTVHFHSAWCEGDRLRSGYADELNQGNLDLLALLQLADDVRTGGMLSQARELRNAATHQFLVWHVESHSESSIPEVTRESAWNAEERLIEGLRLARNALLYFQRAVTTREKRIIGDHPTLAFSLIDL